MQSPFAPLTDANELQAFPTCSRTSLKWKITSSFRSLKKTKDTTIRPITSSAPTPLVRATKRLTMDGKVTTSTSRIVILKKTISIVRRRLSLTPCHSLTCKSQGLISISLRLQLPFRHRKFCRPFTLFRKAISPTRLSLAYPFSLSKNTIRRHMVPLSGSMFASLSFTSTPLLAFITIEIVTNEFYPTEPLLSFYQRTTDFHTIIENFCMFT